MEKAKIGSPDYLIGILNGYYTYPLSSVGDFGRWKVRLKSKTEKLGWESQVTALHVRTVFRQKFM